MFISDERRDLQSQGNSCDFWKSPHAFLVMSNPHIQSRFSGKHDTVYRFSQFLLPYSNTEIHARKKSFRFWTLNPKGVALNKLSPGGHYNRSADIHIYFSFLVFCFKEKQ